MPEALITDFDGTFADSADANVDYYQRFFREALGMDVEDAYIRRRLHLPVRGMLDELLLDESAAYKDELRDQAFVFDYRYDLVKLMPGAAETVRSLSLVAAIVSGGEREHIERILREAKVDDLFETIVGYGEYTQAKPDPEPLRIACQRLEVAPEAAVYIGDHQVDVDASLAAGVSPVFYAPDGSTRKDAPVIQEWSALPAVLVPT
ncbi:MAG: HAD-IA family hydrolase [Patescibacteria group bacterium]